MALIGDAGFKYTPPSASEVTVELPAPLWDLHSIEWVNRKSFTSADRKTTHRVTIGSEVDEVTARIRFISDPAAIKAMLRHGLNGVTLHYYPSLADVGTSYPCELVSVEESDQAIRLGPDADRRALGELECAIHLRRVDGGTFDGLL